MIRDILLSLLLVTSSTAVADCKASVFAHYWQELKTVNEVNDFCAKRASWFRVDLGKYQQKDFCFSSKQVRYDSYGREYYVYPTLFWFKLKDFSAYSQYDVFNSIGYFMRDFSFKGWPSSIHIDFSPSC